jgi:hypothetical protein
MTLAHLKGRAMPEDRFPRALTRGQILRGAGAAGLTLLAPASSALAQNQPRLTTSSLARAQLETPIRGEAGASFTPRIYAPEQMRANWDRFGRAGEWGALQKKMEEEGFVRILNDEFAFGWQATLLGADGSRTNAEFCAYDYVNSRDPSRGGSMLWGDVGGRIYRACITFPPGATTGEAKLAHGQEWFTDAGGRVQRANSFGTRFRRCVRRGAPLQGIEVELSADRSRLVIGGGTYTVTCRPNCLDSAISCAGMISIPALMTASSLIVGSHGTLTIPTLLALGGFGLAALFLCAAVGCGSCILLCAIAAL